jgi:hypothetical protein
VQFWRNFYLSGGWNPLRPHYIKVVNIRGAPRASTASTAGSYYKYLAVSILSQKFIFECKFFNYAGLVSVEYCNVHRFAVHGLVWLVHSTSITSRLCRKRRLVLNSFYLNIPVPNAKSTYRFIKTYTHIYVLVPLPTLERKKYFTMSNWSRSYRYFRKWLKGIGNNLTKMCYLQRVGNTA